MVTSLLLPLLLLPPTLGKISKEQGVMVLDNKNFQEAIDEHSMMLVEFYAPW